jgi:hypothetical protein
VQFPYIEQMSPIPLRAVVAFALVSVLIASCSAERSEDATQDSADQELSGSVLALANSFLAPRGGLDLIELPGGEERPVRLPGEYFAAGGFFHEDGSIIAVLFGRSGPLRTQIYRATTVGGGAAVGPQLEGGPFEFSLAGDTVLAADCDRDRFAHILDLSAPQAWRRVAAACLAALSPDGLWLAYSPDGRSVLRAPVDGSAAPEPVLDLRDLESLPPGMEEDSWVLRMAWGEAGLALGVTSLDRQAVVVVRGDGEHRVMALGDRGAAPDVVLAWQPEGELLAVVNASSLEGIVRLLDPRTGDGRVVALFREPPHSLVFSPDGEVLLTASHVNWSYIHTDGTFIRSLTKQWGNARPFGWAA